MILKGPTSKFQSAIGFVSKIVVESEIDEMEILGTVQSVAVSSCDGGAHWVRAHSSRS
jgi:hypothetical protein